MSQVECKKAQPKEVMFPTVLANSRVAARAPNGELVFLSPSAPFRAFDPHSAAPRVSDILKPDQSRHFNSTDLYDAVQSKCFFHMQLVLREFRVSASLLNTQI